ncbi:MAG TPA: FecR domain-containing protein [Burkholderiales bacterium]|nr:FecR domain-containing protein [Burkholderiales bacterium]
MKTAFEALHAIPAAALEEAAGWFANLADGTATDADRKRLQDWLDAHPDHVRAWKRVEEVTGRFGPVAHGGQPARAVLDLPRAGRRRMLKALSVVVAAGAGGLAALRLPWSQWRHDLALAHAGHRTGIGETLALALEDGSRVWLGSVSALDVSFSENRRALSLLQGDLLVETAKDSVQPARPFTVATRHASLRALGTRFAVRCAEAQSRLDVFEGAVELTLTGSTQTLVVRSGSQATFDAARILATGQADPGRESWSRGILLTDGMRLDALIEELGRWHAQAMECAPEICPMRVAGAFPMKDLDRILAAVQKSLPVRVLREGSVVRIVAAPPAAEGRN